MTGRCEKQQSNGSKSPFSHLPSSKGPVRPNGPLTLVGFADPYYCCTPPPLLAALACTNVIPPRSELRFWLIRGFLLLLLRILRARVKRHHHVRIGDGRSPMLARVTVDHRERATLPWSRDRTSTACNAARNGGRRNSARSRSMGRRGLVAGASPPATRSRVKENPRPTTERKQRELRRTEGFLPEWNLFVKPQPALCTLKSGRMKQECR